MGMGISLSRPLLNSTGARRIAEYRGFSIVFSGDKSLHFHFVFSTQHLLNVPCWLSPPNACETSGEPPPFCTTPIRNTGTMSMKRSFGF